jgi:hypothetical protein
VPAVPKNFFHQITKIGHKSYPKHFISGIRRATGASGMAEFGPALGILLIFFFLPLIDMLGMGVSYCLCMVLNNSQVHEAALLPYVDATNAGGSVMKGIPEQWQSQLGRFVKLTADPQNPGTKITYRTGEQGADQVFDKYVTVQTTCICQPCLPIPLPLVTAPGLNAPMTFQISSERQMENPDNAGP